MDMSRHLKKWLNDQALRELGDVFDGRIVDVVEETIRNRYTAQKTLEPVIVFEDGWRLIPNLTQRTVLVKLFGSDSEDWIGRRVRIFRFAKEHTDKSTGLVKITYEKRVTLPEPATIHQVR